MGVELCDWRKAVKRSEYLTSEKTRIISRRHSMSYELLIETKKEYNTTALHLAHELTVGGVIPEGEYVGVAALVSIDGADADTVRELSDILSLDRTVKISEYSPTCITDGRFAVLSYRNGAFLPNADTMYKQLLLKYPVLSESLRIREYPFFYALGQNADCVIKAVEEYVVDKGDYRRLSASELIGLGLSADSSEKTKSAVYRQPPSLAAKENPGLSEPFSTTDLKMVMDRYRNTTYADMKRMAVLSSKSGDVAVCNDAGYLELVERLGKIGVVMDINDAKETQTYFRMESREPTEMELRIITRCRSERWAHPALYTTINFNGFNDENVEKSIDDFTDRGKKLGLKTENVTLADIVNAPLRYLSEGGETERIRKIDRDRIVDMENGGHGLVIDTDSGKRKLAVTLESNNTKTSVDPSGGATACLGTALRRAMARELHTYDVVRISGIAAPFASDEADANDRNEAAEQRRLAVNALDSFSEYARTVGVPCSGNFEYTSDRFTFKHLEVSAALSVSEGKRLAADDYFEYEDDEEKKRIESGDTVVIFGNRTGRDGRVYRRYLKNEYGSESENSGKSQDNGSSYAAETRIRSELIRMENRIIADGQELMGEAVPGGDALLQNKLMRICSAREFTENVKCVRDVDSSGIVASIAALELGAEVYLDCVPVKYNGMSSTDVAFSETCERMIAVVASDKVDNVIECCAENGVICTRIGFVTEERMLKVYGGGALLANLSVDFLVNSGNNQYITAMVEAPAPQEENRILETANAPFKKMGILEKLRFKYAADHLSAYSRLAAESRIKADTRKRRFDNTFFESTGISHMNRGFAPVSVSYIRDGKGALRKNGRRLCSAVTVGMHTAACNVDPYKGAYYAMTDTLSRLVAAGVPRSSAYSAVHLFHPAYKSEPEQNGDTLAAVAGLYDAQMKLGYPILCGDYSLGGINSDSAKPAVAVIGIAVGKEDIFRASGFKDAGNKLCLFKPEMGKNGLPDAESQREVFDKVEALFIEGKARSAVALTGMSLAEGVMYMCYGADGERGFAFDDDCTPEEIYGTLYGAIAVELEDVKDMPKGLVYGTVLDTPMITLKYKAVGTETVATVEKEGAYGTEKIALADDRLEISMPYLKNISRSSLASVYEIDPYPEIRRMGQIKRSKLSAQTEKPKQSHFCLYSARKPVILVPCFTSSIGADGLISAIQMEEFASDVEIRRLECRIEEESAELLAEHIRRSQMLCLPDFAESPSLLTSMLKHPEVAKAIELLRSKKGLIYGCGASFAALIQAGYIGGDFGIGRIEGLAVAPNPLSGLTRMPSLVNIISDDTPFLSAADKGETYRTEISSYAGRLVGNPDMLNVACVSGVVTTVYAEDKREFGVRYRYDPCESAYRIDSMISADGLIFGQLSFPERARYSAGRGFEGYAPLPVFRSAISYLLHRQENTKTGSMR